MNVEIYRITGKGPLQKCQPLPGCFQTASEKLSVFIISAVLRISVFLLSFFCLKASDGCIFKFCHSLQSDGRIGVYSFDVLSNVHAGQQTIP